MFDKKLGLDYFSFKKDLIKEKSNISITYKELEVKYESILTYNYLIETLKTKADLNFIDYKEKEIEYNNFRLSPYNIRKDNIDVITFRGRLIKNFFAINIREDIIINDQYRDQIKEFRRKTLERQLAKDIDKIFNFSDIIDRTIFIGDKFRWSLIQEEIFDNEKNRVIESKLENQYYFYIYKKEIK